MNHELAARPVRHVHGKKVIEVDTRKARYNDRPWQSLSEFEKRKFENLIVLQNTQEPIHILYI